MTLSPSVMLLLCCIALLLPPVLRSECEVWDEVFHMIDLNNDGTVSKAEFNSVVLNYSSLDDDGQVTSQEFVAAFLKSTQGVCDPGAVRQFGEQLFHLVASRSQSSVPRTSLSTLFDTADVNSDGVILLDEYLLLWSSLSLPSGTDRPHL